MKPYLKKILLAGAILFVLTPVLGILLIFNAKHTIAYGEKNDSSASSYGYRLEQYYVANSMRLTIWNKRGYSGMKSGMTSVYEIGSLSADKAVEGRWVKNGSAIYLDIQLSRDDSRSTAAHARMLYDFPKDEMYTAGHWHTVNRGHLSDDEFDVILNRSEP